MLLELFTSEGCSSCPPADAALARLVRDQPVDGVEVVALGFHVDYWNGLGWPDRFSSRAFTARQSEYARAWRSDRIYTPQAVVNGRTEFIGSDRATARRVLAEASAHPRLPVRVTVERRRAPAARAAVRIDIDPIPDAAAGGDVLLAVSEDGLVSDVRRGENANRRLAHVGVVRRLATIGRVQAGEPFSAIHEVALEPDWRPAQVAIVVFVQHPGTRVVHGVGRAAF